MIFVWLIIFILVLYWMYKKDKEITQRNMESDKRLLEEYKKNGYKMLFIYEKQFNKFIFFHNEHDAVFEIYIERDSNIRFNAYELRKVELYEDNTCAMSVGRAVIGGALFGTAGAIVGGSSGKNKVENLTLVIYTKNLNEPQFTIPLIVSKTLKSSNEYIEAIEFARNVMGALEIVIDKNKEN